MKILVFTSLFPNKLQPYKGIFIKHRVAHYTKLKNCEIRVVAPIPYSPPWKLFGPRYLYSQIEPQEIIDGITVYHPRYPLIPKIGMFLHGFSMFLSSWPLLNKIQREFPFDIIDAHYVYPDGFAAVHLAQHFDIPVTVSARGSDINQFASFKTIRPMIKWAVKNSNHVISVSNALMEEVYSFGINKTHARVIPNGVNSELFRPLSKKKARARLGIGTDATIILSIGHLIPRKGFHHVIECMPRLTELFQNLVLYIVGEGPYRSVLEKQVRTLGIESRVKFVGVRSQSDLNLWYNSADVFCLASSREGWANVVMEALSCGTPVVATNVYGAPEIITSAELGILVNTTAKSISKGLEKALKTEWERDRLVAHVKHRNWFRVAQQCHKVFQSVTKDHDATHVS